ncbi:MAG: TIGR00282 family metallophosphoesterase [Planctomycetota bacterium]|nr:TIGR00282 family metallophosphoesterase [Planctomycetota bacterium]
MKALFIGDIVGKPGRKVVKKFLPDFIASGVHIIVANGENAAGGSGLTPRIVTELFNAGIDVLTSGDHVFRNRDVLEIVDTEERLLRPMNLSDRAKGFGFGVFDKDGVPFAVANFIGRVFLGGANCPFASADQFLVEVDAKAIVRFVDMHAEATSEKVAMGRYLDGRATAVFGTHTHVQTADEQVLEKGTAYITDLGMTGPFDSVLGREVKPVLESFLTGMPHRFDVSKNDPRLSGAPIEFDESTGRANAIRRIHLRENDELPQMEM